MLPQKLEIENPGVKYATKEIEMALTTNKNKPKVRMVKGRVKMVIMGLIMAFTKAITTTPMAADCQLLMVKPGTI
jgi:hypothetical protein